MDVAQESLRRTLTNPNYKYESIVFTPCSDCGEMVTVEAFDCEKLIRRNKLSVHYARALFKKYQDVGYV